ncbi:hypothetical protein H634G_06596 [Metarhizium anisopliae BRIP 53293]|uniref:Xylanolytic transcriptional activator regulatory domain-containing protein n=1 Tax=Metarhizium anisopliae BRIP 53293 TaxID=1291518 RepID=A0A0D9NW57_METAN|nr:hypothetical protein H634G_06596 [Metarhizium anisopliae BRIP 53293]KJK95519.1 hypothetical protein H633G_00590 [Metarhizium anisopliae BRIP 53284]
MAKLVMVGEESLSIYGELLDKMGNALHTSGTDVNYLIGLYFDNMLAFNLFTTRLLAIKFQSASPRQLIALLAAMFSFSARFRSQSPSDSSGELASEDGARLPTANEFHDVAKRHVEKELLGLREPPPLLLLQAMVLISFHELTESAEGRGWRSLGLLVRIAFELRLHILDRDVDDASIWRDPELWSAMEERRRAWWAIWELDVFTSTVRRLPALIDWNENWTKLPVDDVCWIRKTPQRSCYLAADPMERFKLLEACGNKSAKAWFIIANSLMRTACCLSTSQEFFWTPASLNPRRPGRESFAGQQPSLATIQNTYKILGNAVYCFSMALPDHLRYRGQHLFASAASASRATKQHDSHIYSIHVMIQLTEFMLHHCQVFGNACGETEHVLRTSQQGGSYSVFGGHEQEARYDMLGKQYLSAADKILSIVSTSAPDHVQLVNPLLASTIWLAAAVFLVYSYLGISKNLAGEKLVVESNINLLKAVFRQFVAWWDMSNILEVKLAELEKHLWRMRDGDSSFENKDQMSCLDNDQQNTQSHIRGLGTDTVFRSRGAQPPLSQEETVVDDGYDMATSEVSPGRMETLVAGGASNMMTSRNTATLAHEPMTGLFEGDFHYDLELQGFVDSMFAAFRSGDD